jgi:transposase InsO family protein
VIKITVTNTRYQQCTTSYNSQEVPNYYEAKEQAKSDDELTAAIIDIFHKSRQNYGIRKNKLELKKLGIVSSRRRIGRIMKENGSYPNIQLHSLSLMLINVMNLRLKMS